MLHLMVVLDADVLSLVCVLCELLRFMLLQATKPVVALQPPVVATIKKVQS